MKHEPPIVTGLSPKEGIPGTQIIIRGENLGSSQSDVVGFFVCGSDCLASMRWESSHKIIARVTQSKPGLGDVIVVTRSGGRGSCLVQFRVLHALIGPQQESAVWVDETHFFDSMRSGAQEMNIVIEDAPLNIAKDSPSLPLPDNILEHYADSGSNVRLENFHPVRYLLENYRTASYESLESALEHMESQTGVSQEPKNFLKSNLSCILDCVDALSELKEYVGNSSSRPSQLTSDLQRQLSLCSKCGEEVFVDVLKRKEQSDTIRSALTVFQRFRFIFLLPQTIKSHVERGEYGLVSSEFLRAKSLLSEIDVPLLREAFAEAEAQIEKLKTTLYIRLSDPSISLNEQKKIIRYLISVDPDTDAGWQCLSSQCHWLKKTFLEHQRKHAALEKETRYDDAERDYSTQLISELPSRFLFCDVLCSVLASRMGEILKLSEEYVSGQLTAGPPVHGENEIVQMITDIVDCCVALILNAVLPSALSEKLREQHGESLISWKSLGKESVCYAQLLGSLRSCIDSLYKLDCVDQYLTSLLTACMEVRALCLTLVIEQATQSITDLASKESWKLIVCDKEMSKTALPDSFESIVNEVLPIVKTILSHNNYPREKDLLQVEAYKQPTLRSLESLLCSFKVTLERLVRMDNAGSEDLQMKKLRRPSTLGHEEKSKRSPKFTQRKLLIVIANCDYVLRFCLQRLIDRAAKGGMWLTEQLQQRCIVCYGSLRTTLLKYYIGFKCPPLALSYDFLTYREEQELQGVSTYVKDCVLRVVAVQAELFLICPVLYHTVIEFVVKNYHDRITEYAKEHLDEFSSKQLSQLLLDFTAFEESVKAFLSRETQQAISAFKQQIRAPWTPTLQKLLDTYLSREELLISCLKQVALTVDS